MPLNSCILYCKYSIYKKNYIRSKVAYYSYNFPLLQYCIYVCVCVCLMLYDKKLKKTELIGRWLLILWKFKLDKETYLGHMIP